MDKHLKTGFRQRRSREDVNMNANDIRKSKIKHILKNALKLYNERKISNLAQKPTSQNAVTFQTITT